MPRKLIHRLCFLIVHPTRLHRQSRPIKCPRFARSLFATSTPRRRISPLWSAIHCKAILIFWLLIPPIRWLSVFVPSWLLVVKQLPGDARAMSIHRGRIGLTFADIRAARMRLTHVVALLISPRRLSRRRISKSSLTMCHHRRKKRWFIFVSLCLSSMIRITGSPHHYRRRYISYRRHHRIS